MIPIIGAGMAGLLAGAMLGKKAQIHERADKLPNNHHAVLRFRSDAIGQSLGISFKQVEVMKIVKPYRNKIAEAVGYSIKAGGRVGLRSIKTAKGNIDTRYIAPPDFIQQMEERQLSSIIYGARITAEELHSMACIGPVISTIPMHALMELLDFPDAPDFQYRHGCVVKANISVQSDLCATMYYPDPDTPIVRATLTGNSMQIEMVEEFDKAAWGVDRVVECVLHDFGLQDMSYSAEMVDQRYAKIVAIPDRERRKFIMWATDNFNIYALGRYAIWQPGLLLDDVFGDVMRIQQMISDGHNYHGRLSNATSKRSI